MSSNRSSSTSSASRRKSVSILGVAAVAILLMGYIGFATFFPASIKVSPSTGSNDITVEEELKISTTWKRGAVNSVSVKETALDPLGNPVSDRQIPGSLQEGVFVPDGQENLFQPDARYEVVISATLTDLTLSGPRHRDVTETISIQTITTPAPIFLKPSQTIALNEPIIIEFNTPIEDFNYTLAPEIGSTPRIDKDNPTRAFIEIAGYEQGLKYELTITQATGENRASLKKPYTQTVATTDPLKVMFVPGDGEAGVSVGERPSLTFTEAIRNPEMAEQLLTIEPETLGGWEWSEDGLTVEFKPLQNWTQGQTVTIRLKGGPEAFRSETGGFLREDVFSTFNVKPSKMIDVNLTTQTVTLFDNDLPVKTMLASTGSQATPSLTGTYWVYHKAEKVDMRGEGYSAPNVPWVLMFNGDYTIHGNYWATSFGTPTSHGCVGLPVGDAEYLYNWTPIGTIVTIHN